MNGSTVQMRLSVKPLKEERAIARLEATRKAVRALIENGLEHKVVEKLKTTMEQVAFVCEMHPTAKGNYSVLWVFWKKYFASKTNDFERDVVHGTSPETVSRAYRKWIEPYKKLKLKSPYAASEKVEAIRHAREGVVRRNINNLGGESEF